MADSKVSSSTAGDKGSASIEREVKLGAWPGFAPPDLDGIAEGITAVVAKPVVLTATYYDTSDVRLMRWGVTLRHRTGDALPWTIKLPKSKGGGMLVRNEIGFEGPNTAVPEAAADLVLAYARSSPLGIVARLRSRRSSIDVMGPEGSRVAQVVDDEVSVLDGRRVAARFREVEVEIQPDAPHSLLELIVARLRQAGAGAPDPTPKVVRAIGARALDPPELVPVPLGSQPTVGEVLRAALVGAVSTLLRNDPGVRLGHDPEAVHQARVATRRLRSDLRTFRSVVVAEWAEPLRDELSWLAGLLGGVRDADVLIERLERQAAEMKPVDASFVTSVLAKVHAHRGNARTVLLEAMSGPRYVSLLDRLVMGASTPALGPDADRPAREVLPELARRPWRDLKRAVPSRDEQPADETLHALRILAKRARYAAEACVPVHHEQARRLAKAIAGLQTVLGDHQDAVQAEAWIREHSSKATSATSDAFVAGQLVAAQRFEAAAARTGWRDAWDQADRGKLRTWLS